MNDIVQSYTPKVSMSEQFGRKQKKEYIEKRKTKKYIERIWMNGENVYNMEI
jgi:hypothetical protein